MFNDYSLYTHQELIKEISKLFEHNKDSKKYFKKAYKEHLKKYPLKNTIFNFSSDTDNSLTQVSKLMDAIEELSLSLSKIKSKSYSLPLIQNFTELGNQARELYFYHRKSFQGNEMAWNSINKLSKKDAEFIHDFFYSKVSDYIHSVDILTQLGEALIKYANIRNQKTTRKVNNFSVKNLENPKDAYEDFTPEPITSQIYGPFELFTDNKIAYKKKSFNLGPVQWKLLQIFLENKNKPLSIEAIMHLLERPKANPQSHKKYIAKLANRLAKETGKFWIDNIREVSWTFKI